MMPDMIYRSLGLFSERPPICRRLRPMSIKLKTHLSQNQTDSQTTFQFNGKEGICSETCEKFLTRSRRNAAPAAIKKALDFIARPIRLQFSYPISAQLISANENWIMKSDKEDDGSCYYKNIEYSSEKYFGCQACFDFENYSLSMSKNISHQSSESDDSSDIWCDSFSFQDDSINVTLVTEHNLICRDQGWFSSWY